MEFHPYANIFPLMEGREFDDLCADIAANGQRAPIFLHTDGRILDGRNRYRACLQVGVAPMFESWDGVGLATDFVWSLNGTRRQLDGPGLAIWYVLDLDQWRYALMTERHAAQSARELIPNGDGTHFAAFDVRKFSAAVVLSSSIPVTRTEAA